MVFLARICKKNMLAPELFLVLSTPVCIMSDLFNHLKNIRLMEKHIFCSNKYSESYASGTFRTASGLHAKWSSKLFDLKLIWFDFGFFPLKILQYQIFWSYFMCTERQTD
jgi:hypothetical protein